MSVTYCGCVFVALGIQQAKRMRLIVLPCVSCPAVQYFFHVIGQTVRISEKKKVNEHKMCVLIFCTTFVRNISYSKNSA